jgi:hypothetical protein
LAEASKPSLLFMLWKGQLLIGGHHRVSCTIRIKACSTRAGNTGNAQGAGDAAQYEQTCESV